ncbi:hypothetical protein ACFFMM_02660 [Micromonospora chaiyaphumensis]|uniref:Uncharacterized protein n=1 Tax=Micromonospora chaiyaphumensis TaxID=307119 RepID=A0A1C4YYU0_9ACTN|nr:hypothetical protein [Micromonospora chaiyaphumensis]SCF25521.1 hypothetical protein GA0070214_110164 [Micromonospora chaiyaphumensis]
MTNDAGAALGIEAARRLAQLGLVDIQPGLTDAEFLSIERRFGFEFADDHRAFLTAGLPVWTPGHDDHPDKASWGWPNWRQLDSTTLHEQVDWPLATALDGIQRGEWPPGWNRRPHDLARRIAKAQRLLADVPRMVPVYAHRYLPAGRGSSGHPVLSIHRLTDIIVYGNDLAHYIDQEFREPQVTVTFWRDYV